MQARQAHNCFAIICNRVRMDSWKHNGIRVTFASTNVVANVFGVAMTRNSAYLTEKPAKWISYLRCSTASQGVSGLGLEAQQEAITRLVGDGDIIAAFVEVESGKRCDRPQLAAALAKCRETGARLAIGKLDRLARDVHFVAGLMKSDVTFVVADMPTADAFRLHIEAAVAEDEARKIGARTKAALAAAKARGVKLGGDRGRRFSPVEAARGNASKTAKARQYASSIAPVIADLRAQGVTSLKSIAAALNARAVATPRGAGQWQPTQVQRVLSALAQ